MHFAVWKLRRVFPYFPLYPAPSPPPLPLFLPPSVPYVELTPHQTKQRVPSADIFSVHYIRCYQLENFYYRFPLSTHTHTQTHPLFLSFMLVRDYPAWQHLPPPALPHLHPGPHPRRTEASETAAPIFYNCYDCVF